jgi:hypothetical protein
VGLQLFGPDFARLAATERRQVVLQTLRKHRLLLVWDNFESVASMPDPGQATPPLEEAGRAELRDFLAELARPGGRSAVLVTSRAEEGWLGELRRIQLDGLRAEEAAEYADDLLAWGWPAGVRWPWGRPARSRAMRRRMICWGWPPQMPYCWPVRTAKVKQASRTEHVVQMAMAWSWRSSQSAKNGS